jgi:hypothetical protein
LRAPGFEPYREDIDVFGPLRIEKTLVRAKGGRNAAPRNQARR